MVEQEVKAGTGRTIHQSNIPKASKKKEQKEEDDSFDDHNNEIPNDDEGIYNISHEGSLNLSETGDSMQGSKKVTGIPILKSSDKFKSKIGKEEGINRN